MEAAETGIPQGSPVSPILFLFFNAPLLEKCAASKLPVLVGGFVDDVHLLAYSHSTEANCETITKAHEYCVEWAQAYSATFNPKKYELVHLTRRPKKVNMKAAVCFGNIVVEPGPAIRVLGLQIDQRLKWKPYIDQLKIKIAGQERALRFCTKSIGGATLPAMRKIYRGMVQPATNFASSVWHSPEHTPEANKGRVQKLGVMQNGCLRIVLGAYRATPVQVLEAEAEVPSIQLQLDERVMDACARKGLSGVAVRNDETIIRRLQARRGRKGKPPPTPMQVKDQ